MEEMIMNDVVEEMVAEVATEPIAVEVVAKTIDKPTTAAALLAGIGIGLVAKPIYKKVLKPVAKKVYNKVAKPKQIGIDEPAEEPVVDAVIKEEPKENTTK